MPKPTDQKKARFVILEHLKNCCECLRASCNAIGLANHSTNLGSARESLIQNFLLRNLPDAISYVTGEIFDYKQERSGQIDLILIPSTSPKLNLYGAVNLVPADTTLGVIEVKSNLTTGNDSALNAAMNNCYKIKDLVKIPIETGPRYLDLSDHRLLLDYIPYSIFAFEGGASETILRNLKEHLNANNKWLKDAPDMITVLSKNYYLIKSELCYRQNAEVEDSYFKIEGEDEVLLGIFELVMAMSQHIAENPGDFRMPLSKYVKEIRNLEKFFE